MRSYMLILSVAFAFSAIAEQPIATQENKNSTTNKPSILQRVGGFVIDYTAAKGKYLFINCQKTVDVTLIKGVANGLKGDYSWNIELVEGETNIVSLKQAIAEKGRLEALAATIFVDCDALPVMTIMPESNLAVINVREFLTDNPKPILLENRVIREAMRGFALSLGAGYTTFNAGVMQPISSVADLDRFAANFVPADSANAALINGEKIGFKRYRRTTYKRACKEGWAPQPTNEFQRIVWDKVKAEQAQVPTKPIKITPDMKPKGK